YVATGAINGVTVDFLLDTGATDVSIPARVARRIGLEGGRPIPVTTANGVVTVYQIRLATVALGNLAQRDVDANINPHMGGDAVLLGMSFLKHLELRQRGEHLELSAPAG
ncbi:MAG: retroviral-like aspartic protease family protein, partial [Gammaproteobacteria bacterium]|nr:retroviral-like aspartic protease family protein [Gammaproteobacteria bacterium]